MLISLRILGWKAYFYKKIEIAKIGRPRIFQFVASISPEILLVGWPSSALLSALITEAQHGYLQQVFTIQNPYIFPDLYDFTFSSKLHHSPLIKGGALTIL